MNFTGIMIYWINNNKLLLAGIILGTVAGFLYWKLVGCNSGTCLITSKWQNSSAYGGLMGGLLFSMFKKSTGTGEKIKEKENE